jgi:hypothetical protein
MSFTPEEMDRIVCGIRAGYVVTIGGSRCNTSYRANEAGDLVIEHFDEGHVDAHPLSEDELRRVVRESPRDEFVGVLRAPLKDALREAIFNGVETSDFTPATRCFEDLAKYGYDALASMLLVEGVLRSLAANVKHPPEKVSAMMAGVLDGNSLYHAVMQPIGHDKSVAAGKFGVFFFAKVAEALGHEDLRGFRRYRGTFRAMAGDLRGALADFEWEQARMPKGDADAPYLARDIADARDRLGTA